MNLELNLKSFPSVANLTRHKYIFSRVKLTSCALIHSDWFSGSMRRQLSLDPLSGRAERCVTERGARTGLNCVVLCYLEFSDKIGVPAEGFPCSEVASEISA